MGVNHRHSFNRNIVHRCWGDKWSRAHLSRGCKKRCRHGIVLNEFCNANCLHSSERANVGFGLNWCATVECHLDCACEQWRKCNHWVCHSLFDQQRFNLVNSSSDWFIRHEFCSYWTLRDNKRALLSSCNNQRSWPKWMVCKQPVCVHPGLSGCANWRYWSCWQHSSCSQLDCANQQRWKRY